MNPQDQLFKTPDWIKYFLPNRWACLMFLFPSNLTDHNPWEVDGFSDSQEICQLYGTSGFTAVFTRACNYPLLCQMMNPILSIFKIHFNTVHMCTPTSSMRSFALRLSVEFLYAFLLTPMCTVYLICLILCDMIILIYLVNNENCESPHYAPVTSFQVHIFFSLPILKH